MMYAGRVLFTLCMVVAFVAAIPNHLKAVVIDKEYPIPSVSASFGPYSAKAGLGGGAGPAGGLFASADSPQGSASAGLGGSLSGDKPVGGLFASADSPQGSAGAGLGGSLSGDKPVGGLFASADSAGAGLGGSLSGDKPTGGLGASASTGDLGSQPAPAVTVTGGGHHKPPVHQGPTPFDGIFNIPISVLQAVNTYLNNRGPVTKPVHRRRAHRRPVVVYKTVTPEEAEGPGGHEVPVVDRVGSEIPTHTAPAPAAPQQQHGQGHVVLEKRVNYDDIFNIPISALKSVNQLLNGKK